MRDCVVQSAEWTNDSVALFVVTAFVLGWRCSLWWRRRGSALWALRRRCECGARRFRPCWWWCSSWLS